MSYDINRRRKISNRTLATFIGVSLMVAILFGAGITNLMPAQKAMAQSPTTYTQMDATTTTTGMSLYSGRSVHAQYVGSSSALVDKMVDSITLKIRKVGSPTGTAEIGIIDSSGTSMKKVFGTVDVSTLTGTYTDKTYALAVDERAYQIVSGDYIGIKYTGGDATNNHVGVMRDTTAPFDGTNSYHKYYTTSWTSQTDKDLYLKLTYTPPKYVMVHFDDNRITVHTAGLSVLEDHNINTTQFIVCNYANGISGGSSYMHWDEIEDLADAGHSIQNHGENHSDYTAESNSTIQAWVNDCEADLIAEGYSPIMFALPFNEGDDDSRVMSNVEAALPSNAFGKAENGYPQPHDCGGDCDLFVSGSYNEDNRLTMTQWSHDYYRITQNNSAAATLTQFQTVVNTGQVDAYGAIEDLPIVTYHRVDSQGITTTELDTHMAYLEDNGFWAITADDIEYNTSTDEFELKVPG